MAVYDSRVVANYLISKAAPKGLDGLQIMKLTYISHGFTLALLDKPLLQDDVEAWQYGPAIRKIYDCLPGGPRNITEPFRDVPEVEIEDTERAIVDNVFDKYSKHGGLYLSSLTHRSGSPWDVTWRTYGKNAVIPKELIKDHYKGIVAAYKGSQTTGAL